MNITQATFQQKQEALDELNGSHVENWFQYNSIIPLIQKLDDMTFIKFVSALHGATVDDAIVELHTLKTARAFYSATPSQLADALLVATGRFSL